jgi:hypothetical protein
MSEKSRGKETPSLILFLIIGAVAGLIIGVVIWYVFAGIQSLLGVPSYMSGPPIYYLIAWTVAGVFGLPFMMFER